ncbi:lipopolysaccharide export system permease protein [Balneicella halophila]|uniref:Lipopolysaccharide export system permease protein n=1 Tax=Balneicella halophila TaxID=1537566 RepID=A0A7L4UQ19_BALHA|nr:LptF/LptG family permease [Balneicella halophila]PVX50987.1 lipopolysaccharide export system permease protein [Balneicella halophila]
MLKKIDWYIIKKFLGTFFFSLLLIIIVVLVFTYSEQADNFQYNNAPSDVIVKYYLTLAPFFATLFSPTFTFIAVVFFTSKMAFNSEIIGMFSNGISLHRLLRPYFVGAFIIAAFSFILTNFILPSTNEIKNDIYDNYITKRRGGQQNTNIHMQLEKGLFISIGSYSTDKEIGRRVKMERFEDGVMQSTLTASEIVWNNDNQNWTLKQYNIRDINDLSETITKGRALDTVINLVPSELIIKDNSTESMTLVELYRFIEDQKTKGTNNVAEYQVKLYERLASPLATFILTLIGVSLASRKIRGGVGLHLGLGLLIAFSFLMFMRVSTVIASAGTITPLLAIWLPNIIFALIAYILYRLAPK